MGLDRIRAEHQAGLLNDEVHDRHKVIVAIVHNSYLNRFHVHIGFDCILYFFLHLSRGFLNRHFINLGNILLKR